MTEESKGLVMVLPVAKVKESFLKMPDYKEQEKFERDTARYKVILSLKPEENLEHKELIDKIRELEESLPRKTFSVLKMGNKKNSKGEWIENPEIFNLKLTSIDPVKVHEGMIEAEGPETEGDSLVLPKGTQVQAKVEVIPFETQDGAAAGLYMKVVQVGVVTRPEPKKEFSFKK